MPFVERDPKHSAGFFAEVLRSIITPAAKASQFTVKTANRQGSDLIQSTIINDLIDADLVIADLTEHNPIEMFELGMRMAEDKPVVLIKAQGTGPLFDVDNMLPGWRRGRDGGTSTTPVSTASPANIAWQHARQALTSSSPKESKMDKASANLPHPDAIGLWCTPGNAVGHATLE